MTTTRDTKFRLAFDSFVKDVIGVTQYNLQNLTQNKLESRHIYNFSIPQQTVVIGFIDRNGITHTGVDIANMSIPDDQDEIKNEYIPETETFEKQFAATFNPYKNESTIPAMRPNLPPYTHCHSGVDVDDCVVNNLTGDIEGKIFVVYHKKHIPYYVEKDDKVFEKKYTVLLRRFNYANNQLTTAFNDMDELQDDLLYNERQLRIAKKVLYRETNIHKLSETNLINKLRDAYNKLDTKEDCPVCYETIENDNLIIPRCAHYICDSCHPRCTSCPVCRVSYTALEV